jgi:hypothetical protein
MRKTVKRSGASRSSGPVNEVAAIEGLVRIATRSSAKMKVRRYAVRKLAELALPKQLALKIFIQLLNSPRAQELLG